MQDGERDLNLGSLYQTLPIGHWYAADIKVRLPGIKDALGQSTSGSSHQIPLFPIFCLSFTPDFKFCPAPNRNSAYRLPPVYGNFNHRHLRI